MKGRGKSAAYLVRSGLYQVEVLLQHWRLFVKSRYEAIPELSSRL